MDALLKQLGSSEAATCKEAIAAVSELSDEQRQQLLASAEDARRAYQRAPPPLEDGPSRSWRMVPGADTSFRHLPDSFAIERRTAVRQGIKRMLPHIEREQMAALTPELKEALYSLIRAPYLDAEFTVSLLNLLALHGDSSALPTVECLAKIEPASETMRQVWEAADICLKALRSRRIQETASQTLLRSSDRAAPPEVLLRPVTAGPTSTKSKDLLRSINAQEREESLP